MNFERLNGYQPSGLIFCFWGLMSLNYGIILRSIIIRKYFKKVIIFLIYVNRSNLIIFNSIKNIILNN